MNEAAKLRLSLLAGYLSAALLALFVAISALAINIGSDKKFFETVNQGIPWSSILAIIGVVLTGMFLVFVVRMVLSLLNIQFGALIAQSMLKWLGVAAAIVVAAVIYQGKWSDEPHPNLPIWLGLLFVLDILALGIVIFAVPYRVAQLLAEDAPWSATVELFQLLIPGRGGSNIHGGGAAASSQVPFTGGDGVLREFNAYPPSITFKDMLGMEELKAQLLSAVNRFYEEGGNGILLYGPPGNGKTFVAEALAGEIGFSFLPARVGEINSQWINETPLLVRKLFSDARAQAPVVLFLDEVDSLIAERGGGNMHHEDIKATNQLLTEVAALNRGFRNHGVLIMAATNFLDRLDPAAIREKRFDVKIKVPPPDFEARFGLVSNVLSRCGMQYDPEVVRKTVARWGGFSVARIISIAEQICRAYRDQGPLTYEMALEALRDVQGSDGHGIPEGALGLEDLILTERQQYAVNMLLEKLKNPLYFEEVGVTPPRGALFYGPPGTGKSTLAIALAKELRWAFFKVTGATFYQNPDQIGEVVEQAISIRPVVVLIDEADQLIANRGDGGSHPAMTKLLSIMDSGENLQDILFVATTNMTLDQIDPAMLRKGRFSEEVDFTPDWPTLTRFAAHFLDQREHVQWKGDLQRFLRAALEQSRQTPTQTTIYELLETVISEVARRNNWPKEISIDFDTLNPLDFPI